MLLLFMIIKSVCSTSADLMIDTLVSFNLPDNHTNLGSAPDIASGVPLLEDVVARPVGGRLWRGRGGGGGGWGGGGGGAEG